MSAPEGPVVKSLVYKGYPPDHCCCDSCLRIMPDGTWAAIFMTGGKSEPEPENHIRICHSTDSGYTWSKAEVVHQFADRACLLSEVYVEGDVVTMFVETHTGRFGDWKVSTTRSADSGRTWSDLEPFVPAPRRAFVRNRFVASWGEWFLPLQSYDIVDDPTPSPMKDGSFKTPYDAALVSGDQGKTWAQSGRIEPCHAWAESNITELSDGRLVMLVRYDGSGCLYRSDSTDRGRTWTEAEPTSIPNPGSKIRLHRLSDGRICLVHNPNSATSHPNSKRAANCNRNPLSLWMSDDDMRTWGYRQDLIDFPGMLAYPDGIIDDKEEWLHFTFDYNRHDVIYVGVKLPDGK